MAIAKIYNSGTAAWEPAIVGKEGPQGIQGIQGEIGPNGVGVPAVGTDDQVLTVVAGAPAWADAGAGSETFITTQTETGFLGVMTFSSIPQIYKHLKVVARYSGAATNEGGVTVRDNNSANGYAFTGARANGTVFNGTNFGYHPSRKSTYSFVIQDYTNTDFGKILTWQNLNDATNTSEARNTFGGGHNRSLTGAVTQLSFTLNSATTDLTMELWGIS
tara:strand:+ start:1140 stop:1793 length:654 start_codon:yes stop_codon:yes gene_type:complete